MWEESDFVTFETDHELVASIANRNNPGSGEFRKVAGVEHKMRKAASVDEAIRAPSNESSAPIIVGVMDEWAKRIFKTPWQDSMMAIGYNTIRFAIHPTTPRS